MARKPSIPTRLVFQALLDAPSRETYGFELAEVTGLPSGTIYPILRRLEDRGFVESRWELIEAGSQRRRRRYYKLTGEGRRAAQETTVKEREAMRLLAPGWAGVGWATSG